MTYYSTEINTIFTIIISMIFFFVFCLFRGEIETVQANEIAASAWMDNKVVTAMYSGYDPSESTTVLKTAPEILSPARSLLLPTTTTWEEMTGVTSFVGTMPRK